MAVLPARQRSSDEVFLEGEQAGVVGFDWRLLSSCSRDKIGPKR